MNSVLEKLYSRLADSCSIRDCRVDVAEDLKPAVEAVGSLTSLRAASVCGCTAIWLTLNWTQRREITRENHTGRAFFNLWDQQSEYLRVYT